MVELFKQIGKEPNLLTPDLVLNSKQLTYLIMEKGGL